MARLAVAAGLLVLATPASPAWSLGWSAPAVIDPGSEPPVLEGVSCLSESLCVAVDDRGDVVSSTDPASAGSWRVSRPYVGRVQEDELSGVSCAAVGACFVSGVRLGTLRSSTDPTGGAGAWVGHPGSSGYALSCPSRSLCVGVAKGKVLSSTEPLGGAAWRTVEVDEERLLTGVSCPSVSFCVAVDTSGNVLTSAEPTGGKEAWQLASVDPGHVLLGVSCESESLCVAVDREGDVLNSTDPAGGAGAWSVSEVIKGVAIEGVSCSESLCVAVDEAGDVLVSSDPTGGVWSVVHVDEHALYAVSCASEVFCVATGADGDVLFGEPGGVEPMGLMSAWTLEHVDASGLPIAAVSCASGSLCVASDVVEHVLTSTDPQGGAGAWSVGRSSLSPELGVSCPSTSLCVGVGESLVSASSEPADGATTWKGQADWYYPPLLEPGAAYFGPTGSVSCATETLCVANGDSFNDFDTLLTSTDPTGGEAQWHLVVNSTFKGSGNKVSPPYVADPILGVSCASATLCVAVDGAGNVLTSTNPGSSESVWTIAAVDTHPLEGVSCASEELCVAVDDVGDVVSSTDPTGGPAAWSVSDVDSHGLTAVSCPSESLCVAVDEVGDVLTSSEPSGGAGAWTLSEVDSSDGFTAVSCPSEELCVAVDNAGKALIGTGPATAKPHHGGGGGGGQTGGGTSTASGEGSGGGGQGSGVSGAFDVLSVAVGRDGDIRLVLRAADAGSFDARGSVSLGTARTGSHRYASKRTRRIATYGATSGSTTDAGAVTVTIKPTRAILDVLRSKRALRVTLTIVFDPRGGSPTTVGKTVTVRYRPSRSRRSAP